MNCNREVRTKSIAKLELSHLTMGADIGKFYNTMCDGDCAPTDAQEEAQTVGIYISYDDIIMGY